MSNRKIGSFSFLKQSKPLLLPFPEIGIEAQETVIAFRAAGLNCGTNVGVVIESADGVKLFESVCDAPLARLRDATFRDLLISMVRATKLGLMLEFAIRSWRTGRTALPVFALEVPSSLLRANGNLVVKLSRLTRIPILVSEVTLQSTSTSPTSQITCLSDFEAFPEKGSVQDGNDLTFCMHSNVGELTCSLLRYGIEPESAGSEVQATPRPQPVPNSAYRHSPNWPGELTIRFPGMGSGLYALKVHPADNPDAVQCVPVVVRKSNNTGKADVLLIASTNTWAAYNEWGGASLYYWRKEESLGRSQAKHVTRLRPNPAADPEAGGTHLARGLRALVSWLETHDVSYDLVADEDIEQTDEPFEGYKAVMLDCHAEYWTEASLGKLENHIENGGSLISFSANALYWRTECFDDLVEVMKPSGWHSNNAAGGMWGDLGRSEARLLGTAYTRAGAKTYAPFEVERPEHWIFSGTSVRKGQTFGHDGQFGDASGHETDKLNRYSPDNTVRVARGTNSRRGGAHMAITEHKNGGIVFSCGSITFVGSLASDQISQAIVFNVLRKIGITYRATNADKP